MTILAKKGLQDLKLTDLEQQEQALWRLCDLVLSFHLSAGEMQVSTLCTKHIDFTSLKRFFFLLCLWLQIDCWSASVAPKPWRESAESQEQVWVNDTPLIHRPCLISSCKVARVSHSFISFNTMREEGPWHKRSTLFNDFVRLAFNSKGVSQEMKTGLKFLEGILYNRKATNHGSLIKLCCLLLCSAFYLEPISLCSRKVEMQLKELWIRA